MTLNEHAHHVADHLAAHAALQRVALHSIGGARVIDCGVAVPGGWRAGVSRARVCLSGRGEVVLVPSSLADLPGPAVQVASDDPVMACMASQYAGWQVSAGKFFAMGSGPMRAAYGKEDLFDHLPGREKATVAVGVLESRKLPTEEVVTYLCQQLNLTTSQLTLLVAPP